LRIGTFRAFRKTNADRHVEHLKLDAVEQVLAGPIKDRLADASCDRAAAGGLFGLVRYGDAQCSAW